MSFPKFAVLGQKQISREAEHFSSKIAAIFVNDKTELTNQRPACMIRAGKSLIGRKYNRVDQCSSRGVRKGTRAQKTAGDRAYVRVDQTKSR